MSEKKKIDEITPSNEIKNGISTEELLERLDAAVNEKKAEITDTEIIVLQDTPSISENITNSGEEEDNQASNKDGSEKKVFETFIKIALIVLVIALIIITVGWLFSKLNKPEYEDAVIVEDEENELDLKKKRLKDIEIKIAPLELKKAQIQKTEKRFLIAARILIGFSMLLLNVWFAHKYIYFDNTFELNKILNFNSAILLCYSFIAFVSHGTPTNFVAALKNIISNYLKRKHIDTLTELEKLIKEREHLISEIEILEKAKK